MLSLDAATASSDTCVLAGKPSAKHVRANNGACPDSANVAMIGHVGPVTTQDSTCVWINFGLPDDAHSRSLKAEVEAADTGKEASNGERTQAGPSGI